MRIPIELMPVRSSQKGSKAVALEAIRLVAALRGHLHSLLNVLPEEEAEETKALLSETKMPLDWPDWTGDW